MCAHVFVAPSNLLGMTLYGMTLYIVTRIAKPSRILSVLGANQDSYVRPTHSFLLVRLHNQTTSSSFPFSWVYSRHVDLRVRGLLG